MTTAQLEIRLGELVREERRVTREVLLLIKELEMRRVYVERGFTSMHDYLIEVHGYSQSAANRRVQAARVLRDVPETAEKLLAGEMNLTTLAQVQTAIRREEKSAGRRLSVTEKRELVSKAEGRSDASRELQLSNRTAVYVDDETLA